jgi:hypothetical protein
MEKGIVVFCLYFFPFAVVYSQSGTDSVCNQDIKNIFKAHDLKIKYETVQYIYKEYRKKRKFPQNFLDGYFEIITGLPLYSDSISDVNLGELTEVKWMSEEEMDRYVDRLNCTPEKAFGEYKDFIANIKLEKEIYLNYIDAELFKSDSSEYAKDKMFDYDFIPPMQSILPPCITKLDFLKIFKKFIFNDNEDVLPDGARVYVYLKCNCKIP